MMVVVVVVVMVMVMMMVVVHVVLVMMMMMLIASALQPHLAAAPAALAALLPVPSSLMTHEAGRPLPLTERGVLLPCGCVRGGGGE